MKAAGEAKADGLLSPAECEAALKDPKTLLVDLRDAGDRSSWCVAHPDPDPGPDRDVAAALTARLCLV